MTIRENTQAMHDKMRENEVLVSAYATQINNAKNILNDARRFLGNGSFAQFDGTHEDSKKIAADIDEWMEEVSGR